MFVLDIGGRDGASPRLADSLCLFVGSDSVSRSRIISSIYKR